MGCVIKMSGSCPGAVQHRAMDVGLVYKSLMKKMDGCEVQTDCCGCRGHVCKRALRQLQELASHGRGQSIGSSLQMLEPQNTENKQLQSVHEGCCLSAHVLTGHLSVFCGEMSIQVLCPFSNWIFCLFVVELQEFVDIFWILNSCQINVFQIFYFILCIVFPLIMSCNVQKFFILMRSN